MTRTTDPSTLLSSDSVEDAITSFVPTPADAPYTVRGPAIAPAAGGISQLLQPLPALPPPPPIVRTDALAALPEGKSNTGEMAKLTAAALPKAETGGLNLLAEIQRATNMATGTAGANVSKSELAIVLEGFAHVLRADANYTAMSYTDHIAEVTQLKELLVEAQETIINLLNDRVFDRAKLARLEAEVRLLPDLQAQAHKAMSLADQSAVMQTELSNVSAEVERLRTSYMRSDQRSSGWINRLFRRG